MKLIEYSGSTKTEWRILDEINGIHSFSSGGINPYLQTGDQIAVELKNNLQTQLQQLVKGKTLNVFFYGAGCSNETNCSIVKNAILSILPGATVQIEHDLLAAARALCGQSEGIAAILGTGSNTCYYDGKQIMKNIPALGYVLGDEGSGAHIGKKLIVSLLYDETPKEIAENFYSRFNLTKDSILNSVYKQPNPNRFLASFMPFIRENQQHRFCMELVSSSFNEFFDRLICKYEKHREIPMGCVGSVGFHFSPILQQVAAAKGVRIGKILKNPMEELVGFHKGE